MSGLNIMFNTFRSKHFYPLPPPLNHLDHHIDYSVLYIHHLAFVLFLYTPWMGTLIFFDFRARLLHERHDNGRLISMVAS